MKQRFVSLFIITVLVPLLVVGCNQQKHQGDLSSWDEVKTLSFFQEIHEYIRTIPRETNSLEEIVEKYQNYFSPELSAKIVDSLYEETGNRWTVPDGDSGYIFIVPTGVQGGNELTITYSDVSIRVREEYPSGMYSALEYKIEYSDRPLITEWKVE